MKFLFDENLSPRLVEALRDLCPDAIHVRDVGLASATDDIIWDFAAAQRRIIITKDADFNQRAFLLGPPPKVVWLRGGNVSTAEVARMLRNHHSDIVTFEQDSEAALLALK